MRYRSWNGKTLRLTLILTGILFTAGCLYNLNLKKPYPLPGNLKDYQPIAVLPIQDATGHRDSGSNLYSAARSLLAEKGYNLVDPSETSETMEELRLTPQALLSDQASLAEVSERLGARLLVVGTILEYRLQKSYVRSEDFQVWEGGSYEYRTLPTYHYGTCEIGLKLRIVDPKKGSVVWTAEGTIRGPNAAAQALGRRLVNRLLKDIPSLPTKP